MNEEVQNTATPEGVVAEQPETNSPAPEREVLPLNDYVLVREVPKESVRESGLIIPETTNDQDRVAQAEVIQVGTRKEFKINPGDIILFKGFAVRQRITVNGEELFFLNPDDVIGVSREKVNMAF